jgi:hypothetical protein
MTWPLDRERLLELALLLFAAHYILGMLMGRWLRKRRKEQYGEEEDDE